jgi:hypothetical protein
MTDETRRAYLLAGQAGVAPQTALKWLRGQPVLTLYRQALERASAELLVLPPWESEPPTARAAETPS